MSAKKPLTQDWHAANQRYLMGAIAQMRQALQHQIEPGEFEQEPPSHSIDLNHLRHHPAFQTHSPALEHLCHCFDLSLFERDIILLCAGMEFDPHWGKLCADAQGYTQRDYPTLSLALALSPTPYWGALTQAAPLRHWRFIEIGAGNALTNSPLRLDEQLVHYLTGLDPLDERLAGLGAVRLQTEPLVASHQSLVKHLADSWLQASQEERRLPVLQLCGTESASKRSIATAACQLLELELYQIAAAALPTDINQLQLIQTLWEREWQLHQRVFLLDCDRLESREGDREAAIAYLLNMQAPLIVTNIERRSIQHSYLTFEVSQPSANEQRAVWQNVLGELTLTFNGQIDTLVSQFNLSATAIEAAAGQFTTQQQDADSQSSLSQSSLFNSLWNACRMQARPRLDELAQRIETTANWDDLVLPEQELGVLQEIAAHVRQRAKVYEQWGFGAKSQRGLGISALFSGASGTGKTLAAEVLGNTLNLDVYRIDLSAVVSKYIGETEKNLRRVFDAAEGGGVILLFDEADALFGKRTEVKDSHDRHANLEVSYLLQRMEAYRGLAILTTNLKASLDQAFLRRIRFVVPFPFPDAVQRSEIWRRIFPDQAPIDNLDFQKLAKLNVAGGNIRNIALNAAFLAADAEEQVGMKHVLQAAKSEYMKLERPLTDAEVKGWV